MRINKMRKEGERKRKRGKEEKRNERVRLILENF